MAQGLVAMWMGFDAGLTAETTLSCRTTIASAKTLTVQPHNDNAADRGQFFAMGSHEAAQGPKLCVPC